MALKRKYSLFVSTYSYTCLKDFPTIYLFYVRMTTFSLFRSIRKKYMYVKTEDVPYSHSPLAS